MYLFDPSLLQIVMAIVAALAAAFLAAWLVTGAAGSTSGGEGAERTAGPTEDEGEELETRQRVIVWAAAGAAVLFLLWWATLSTGSGGRPTL